MLYSLHRFHKQGTGICENTLRLDLSVSLGKLLTCVLTRHIYQLNFFLTCSFWSLPHQSIKPSNDLGKNKAEDILDQANNLFN